MGGWVQTFVLVPSNVLRLGLHHTDHILHLIRCHFGPSVQTDKNPPAHTSGTAAGCMVSHCLAFPQIWSPCRCIASHCLLTGEPSFMHWVHRSALPIQSRCTAQHCRGSFMIKHVGLQPVHSSALPDWHIGAWSSHCRCCMVHGSRTAIL